MYQTKILKSTEIAKLSVLIVEVWSFQEISCWCDNLIYKLKKKNPQIIGMIADRKIQNNLEYVVSHSAGILS